MAKLQSWQSEQYPHTSLPAHFPRGLKKWAEFCINVVWIVLVAYFLIDSFSEMLQMLHCHVNDDNSVHHRALKCRHTLRYFWFSDRENGFIEGVSGPGLLCRSHIMGWYTFQHMLSREGGINLQHDSYNSSNTTRRGAGHANKFRKLVELIHN